MNTAATNCRHRCVYAMMFTAGLMFSSACGVQADSKTQEPDATLARKLEKISSIDTTFWDGKKQHIIRELLAGDEEKAVAFTLDMCREQGSYRQMKLPHIEVLRACEEETLTQLKGIVARSGELGRHLNNVALTWATTVTLPEALRFVIDQAMKDDEVVEYDIEELRKRAVEMDIQGKPKRPCDKAYNLAAKRIHAAGQVFRQRPLSTLDSIAIRDERLGAFKSWWNENKAFLAWSDTEKKFVVNQEAKKAAQPKTE